jgi:hypothetical protein
VLFACSGIVVRRVKHVTRFLTSANFVEALNEKRKDHDNLKVDVADHPFSNFPFYIT